MESTGRKAHFSPRKMGHPAPGYVGVAESGARIPINPQAATQDVASYVSTMQTLFRGYGGRCENFLFQLFRCGLINALGDEHGVALHLDDDRPVFGQPRAPAR